MLKINSKLARILGHLYGDGCIDSSGKLYYINKNEILIHNFIKDIKGLFKKAKIKIYRRSDGVKRVYVEKSIPTLLRNQFKELKTRTTIPSLIKSSTPLIKSNFLQAIFDDEGSVLWDHKTSCRIISIAMKNRVFITQLNELLHQLGIKTNKTRRIVTSYSSLWGFTISAQENLENFSKIVNFSHPIKHKKLNDMLQHLKQPHSEKSKTILKILTKLETEPLTIPEIQKFIGKSETQTRRILNELQQLQKIDKHIKTVTYNKRGIVHYVNKWKTL